MLAEVLQVLRGAGKVGSALMLTQGEQLRLMACNSSLAAGVKAAQDAAEGAMAALFGTTSQNSVKEDVFPDAEGWENMDPEEAAKWAVGSEFPPDPAEHNWTKPEYTTRMHTGAHPDEQSPAGGSGWPRSSSRFLHSGASLQRFYHRSRSVHNTVVTKLTPEDMKKAREAKQALVKPVRQKVGPPVPSGEGTSLIFITRVCLYT
ncbi:atypical kinase COQ8B, mitochondrial-like isoform X2 [Oryzias melastigma]|nr:atypical kinase COQ8B, mitochondrial-like isoform X2 [Oryzias melastigma]